MVYPIEREILAICYKNETLFDLLVKIHKDVDPNVPQTNTFTLCGVLLEGHYIV
jgi:hypothetical protein